MAILSTAFPYRGGSPEDISDEDEKETHGAGPAGHGMRLQFSVSLVLLWRG